MNNKKNIIWGSIAVVLGLVGVFGYFFIPGIAENMSFTVLSSTTGTDLAVSDIDIASSTDEIVPPSTDESISQQEIVTKKVSHASAASEIASGDSSESSAPVDDTSSPPSAENNSPSPIIPASSCSFPSGTSSALSREIIFNEIAWMGSASSSNAEWMEIKNVSANTIDLTGWELLNASGKITIVFSSGDTISAGGLLLLSRNSSSSGKLYFGSLVNTGDTLAIMDPQCDVSDFLDASSGWPAGNNTTKQTMERDANGIGWHTSVSPGGTPDAENSAVVPPIPKISTSSANTISSSPPIEVDTSQPINSIDVATTTTTTVTSTSTASTSHLLIAAIQISGESSTNDLVRLYNPTGASIDISGWKLHKRSQTGTDYSLKVFPTGSVILAGQFFVWANSINGFSEDAGADVSSTETLSADNSVALLDPTGAIVDAVAWGTGTNQYGEGSPYPTDPQANQILVRQLVDESMVDTSNNANDFIVQ